MSQPNIIPSDAVVPQIITLSRWQPRAVQRDPDVYVNEDTGAFGTEAMAMADGGRWQGYWRVDQLDPSPVESLAPKVTAKPRNPVIT